MASTDDTPLEKLAFLQPSNGIDGEAPSENKVINQLQVIGDIKDDDSCEFNLDDFDFPSLLGLNNSPLGSDPEIFEESSDTGRTEQSASTPTSEDGYSQIPDKAEASGPLFTEKFSTDSSKQTKGPQNGEDDSPDRLSLISSSTVSSIDYEEAIEGSTRHSVVTPPEVPEVILTEKQIRKKFIIESLSVGSSSMLQRTEFVSKYKEKPENTVSKPFQPSNQVSNVNSLVSESSSLGRLLFTAMIQISQTSKRNFLSEHQYQKMDAEALLEPGQKVQLSIASYARMALSTRQVESFYKQHTKLMKKLTSVFENQKLYFDLTKKGEITNVVCYNARQWRKLEYTRVHNGNKLISLMKSDGWSGHRVPLNVDFNIITRGYSLSWTKELFEPLIVFPRLDSLLDSRNSSMVLSLFSPLLYVLPEGRKALGRSKSKSPKIFKDVLNARPLDNKAFGKVLFEIVQDYVYAFTKNFRIRNSERNYCEELVQNYMTDVLEAAIQGYIEAFNILDSYSSLDSHGSEEIYVKMYNFYENCPVTDLGVYLIQAFGNPALNKRITRQRLHGKPSSEVMEIIIANNYGNMDPMVLHYLRLIVAYIQSPYITKYILRRLLFWVDNKQMNTFTYMSDFTWYKDPKDFGDQITVCIRDNVISHFRMQKN